MEASNGKQKMIDKEKLWKATRNKKMKLLIILSCVFNNLLTCIYTDIDIKLLGDRYIYTHIKLLICTLLNHCFVSMWPIHTLRLSCVYLNPNDQ